jgi:hypothetical protein
MPKQRQVKGIGPGKSVQNLDGETRNRWDSVEEIDEVLDSLEGRLVRIMAVIQRTPIPERLLSPAAAAEVRSCECRGT